MNIRQSKAVKSPKSGLEANLCKSCRVGADSVEELALRAAEPRETYGFRYFDKPVDYDDEDDDREEYEEKSCGATCCDNDCECDDCLRCSDTGLLDVDSYTHEAVAA